MYHQSRIHELARLADFCGRHDLALFSDEVHADLILDPNCSHTSLLTIQPPAGSTATTKANITKTLKRSITIMSANKTFNTAGLGFAFAIIPDTDLRLKFSEKSNNILPPPTALSIRAAEAIYTEYEKSTAWREALKVGDQTNCGMVIETRGPILKMQLPPGYRSPAGDGEFWARRDDVTDAAPVNGCRFGQ